MYETFSLKEIDIYSDCMIYVVGWAMGINSATVGRDVDQGVL